MFFFNQNPFSLFSNSCHQVRRCILQERLVVQAAEEEVFKEGLLDALEEDLTHFDELEKMTMPPRQG